jgi:serine kinase
LGDFGFARSTVDLDGSRLLSETYCGSAAYAAPEVVKGYPYNPMMSDIWSLGVILFIMINAAMPFDDSNLKKMLKDQQNKNWHIRTRVKDKLSADVKDILTNILEPDVTKRVSIERIREENE